MDYASKEAYEKAGLVPTEEELEDDGEFVNLEDVEEEPATGDHSMQT